MTVGFALMAMSMAYGAGVQRLIYARAPCFSRPLACDAAIVVMDGDADTTIRYRPNEISVWAQAPLHLFLAAGEIFAFVALNEFVYAEAPTNMKALVKALEQFTASLAAALGMALGPVSKDPKVMIMYAALAGTMAVTGATFYGVFRPYDARWQANQECEAAGKDEEQAADIEVLMTKKE